MMNRIKSNVYMLLAMAVCFAVGSCSGEEDSSVPEVLANPDALCTITPHAIKINVVDASTTPITRSATGEPEKEASYAVNLGSNSSVEATLEAVPQDAQTRAGASLAAGAQYRIVAYDGTSGEIKGNVVYKQGSTAVVSGKEIKLKAGNYRLFAYTFNSTDAIRGLDADNKNVTVNGGEDFMTYAVPNYTVSSTDYGSGKQLNISFTRQCARMMVTIKADGYTDNTITSASLTVGNVFGSGNKWNGTTNTDASILPSVAGTAALVKATASGVSVDCGPSADNPYLITAPCTNQTISISELFVDRRGDEVAPSDFNFFNPVTLVKGGSYRLTITICNSYVLTRTNPVTIGGTKWARTNLQQDGAGISAPVSFVVNPWDWGSYWQWGMRDATVYGGNVSLSGNVDWNTYTSSGTNQNPCRALNAVWRLPTNDELTTLKNNIAPKGTKVRINGTINTIGDKGWAPVASGLVCMSGNKVIFLPAARMRHGDGSMNASIAGFYWSGTPYDGYYSYMLLFTVDILQVSGYFNYRYEGYTLRCVHD